MKFRTVVRPDKPPFLLSPEEPTLFLGSCFTEHIGSRLRNSMSPAEVNPCGVQYNPSSIARLLRMATESAGSLPDNLFFFHSGLWKCWLLPSSFSSPELEDAKNCACDALRKLAGGIGKAQALFLTFGTAQVYRHNLSHTSGYDGIVSNCHKVPAAEFSHEMLTVGEITDEWKAVVATIRKVKPDIKIIYTVSPVRHPSPSVRLNTLSKATLHLAVNNLVSEDPECSCYFPAWELLMDDLRDYRFYGADLTHPSEQAADYIMEAFMDCFFTDSDRQILEKGASIMRRLSHRPLTGDIQANEKFRKETERLARDFIASHPGLALPVYS